MSRQINILLSMYSEPVSVQLKEIQQSYNNLARQWHSAINRTASVLAAVWKREGGKLLKDMLREDDVKETVPQYAQTLADNTAALDIRLMSNSLTRRQRKKHGELYAEQLSSEQMPRELLAGMAYHMVMWSWEETWDWDEVYLVSGKELRKRWSQFLNSVVTGLSAIDFEDSIDGQPIWGNPELIARYIQKWQELEDYVVAAFESLIENSAAVMNEATLTQ